MQLARAPPLCPRALPTLDVPHIQPEGLRGGVGGGVTHTTKGNDSGKNAGPLPRRAR